MKFIVAIHNKVNSWKEQALNCLVKKEGQNTVEYVLMLVVIVAIALAAGAALKKWMPDLVDKVKAKVGAGMDSLD
ncbi:MAG: hypothetical protein J5601_04030 [Elusimicrobiaceae bacterium]|nr:hypothetical protein [Elusimicrobiaceae bacterium]